MNRLKFKNIAFLLLVTCTVSSCKKFLEERSQTLQYVTNAGQLDELLVGDGYMAHSNEFKNTVGNYMPWLNVMDDDITESVRFRTAFDVRDDVFGFYTWQSKPFVSVTYSPKTDDTWTRFYKHINAVNNIYAKAKSLTDNPAALKRIEGEALFLRAGYYFLLVNTYAKAYRPSTAETDLGVPLKITEFVETSLSSRASIAAVYAQILADLKEAEEDLNGTAQKSLYHADVNAVNLLQSRVYLYMQDWQNAATAAQKVISRKPALYNLTVYTPGTGFFTATSPEAIFTQGTNSIVYLMYENWPTAFKPSAELMELYSQQDLRKSAFFAVDNSGNYRYTKVFTTPSSNTATPEALYSDNFFLRNAEAYLNLAEATAMLGQDATAVTALNTLRKSRFSTANYQDVNFAAAELVSFIRDERRRELCFEGQRWFDLRRYAVNVKYPFSKTITHPYSVAVIGSASLKATQTLLPDDPAYVIPLPDPAIQFNDGSLIQNPERPNRSF